MKKFFAIVLFLAVSFSAQAKVNLSDAWVGEPASNFRKLKTVSASKHMVVTADVEASKAGEEMLKKGGNAIDAIIAAQMVLNVVEPQASGIGGGGFLLYYDAKTKQTTFYNGRETAPEKAFPQMFLQDGKAREFNDVVRGGLSVATPGALKILKEVHEKYGKLKWEELFEPAIKLARNGFVVSPRLHTLMEHILYLKDFEEAAKVYLKSDKTAYAVGEKITNPKFGDTLEIIAKQGIEPFYEGKIADDIVTAVKKSKINPGFLSKKDLQNYRSKKGDLICSHYRKKYKVCSMPLPSSGGVTLLQILGILENFDLHKMKPQSPEAVHLVLEATRLAYADRNEYLGDISGVPLEQMLDKEYLKSRAALIAKDKALEKVEAGKFVQAQKLTFNHRAVELPSTTHMSVVDDEGNAISFTSSIEYFFGSALMVDGFLLNNQMTDFSFLPEINGKKVANRIEPNKQPRSSMTPTFVFDDHDNLIMVVGSPGGPRIIQYTLRTIIDVLDWQIDVQKAVSMPNYVVLNDVVELEKNSSITKLQKSLQAMGHKTIVKDLTSGIHAITFSKNGLKGGADPRRDGVAIGI